MIFVCVCESTKKSLPRIRKILSKYFRQIGRRTWIGQLSQEGAVDLQEEVKKVATRQTSVSCWKLSKLGRSVLYFHVGSKERFSEIGEFSYSMTGNNKKDFLVKTSEDQFLLTILRLAALFHDLGKASVGFQNKLVSSMNSEKFEKDVARHEVISCFVLNGIFQQSEDDISLFKDLSTQNQVEKIFIEKHDSYLQSIRDAINKYQKTFIREPWPDFECFIKKSENSKKITQFILWLVLSHHKLPDGDTKTCKGVKNLWRFEFHDSEKEFNHENKKEILSFLSLKETKKPWEDTKTEKNWCAQVAKNFNTLVKILESGINTDFLDSYVSNFLRPILIISDYTGSSQKEEFKNKDLISSNTFANTIDIKNIRNNKKEFADTLETHLKKVENYSKFYFNRIFGYESENLFRFTSPLNSKPQNQERFDWQHQVYKSISTLRKQDKLAPVFCVLTAGTGSGKTRAIPLACSAASRDDKMRYSLGLGLRTLTLQTGAVYKNQNIFKTKDFAVVIGDKLAKELWELEQENEDNNFDNESNNGSSNSNEKLNEIDEGYLIIGGEEIKNSWPCLNPTQAKILSTPIVVATVDHFVSGAEICRGSDSFMALRLMTSDLVLDEIDSYSAADLIPIGRLVYMAGLYGKNVILASASVQKVIVDELYKSFSAGICDSLIYKKSDQKNIIICFASNFKNATEAKILDYTRHEDFQLFYSSFLKNHISYISTAPKKNSAVFVDVEKNLFRDKNFEIILTFAKKMHDNHSIDADINDVKCKFSIGFIRWNRTHVCREFAKWLMKEQENSVEFSIAVLCYQSHMTLLDRRRVEKFLDINMNRSSSEEQNKIFNSPEFSSWYKKNKCPINVMIVVSTTSIQETGRDHDYDWAILDPCSTRSIVQSAGRVLRHRPHISPVEANIGLLKYPSQLWAEENENKNNRDDKSKKAWAYPGIETDSDFLVPSYFGWRPNKKKSEYETLFKKYQALEILLTHSNIQWATDKTGDVDFLNNSESTFYKKIRSTIDSSICLIPPSSYSDSPMTALEIVELTKHLRHTEQSLNKFVENKKLRLSLNHFIKTKFRKNRFFNNNEKNDNKPEIYFSKNVEEKRWNSWMLKTHFDAFHNNGHAIISCSNEYNILFSNRNFFFNFNLMKELEETQKLLEESKNKNSSEKEKSMIKEKLSSLEIPIYWSGEMNKFTYNPIFGLGKREK